MKSIGRAEEETMQGATMPGGQRRGVAGVLGVADRGRSGAMVMMIAVVGGLHVLGFADR